MHKLEADGIELFFRERRILSNIYIKSETGKITGLLARNGEGKTSLLDVISGNLKAKISSIRFDEQTIVAAGNKPELLTYLPQFNFIPASLKLTRVFNDFNIGYNDFESIFPEFKNRNNELICNLSGGERRLIEVYLLVKSKTQFTMLDEPFSQLMPLHIEKICSLVETEKAHKGVIITDHLYRHVTAISDNIYMLKDGTTYHIKNLEELATLGYINP